MDDDAKMQPTWQTADGSVQLYHADCLAVLPTLEPGSMDAVVTDPPYGHNNNNNDLILRRECALGKRKATTTELQADKTARPIANDGPEANEVFRQALPLFFRVLKPGCCCCCCCGGPDPQFARWSLWMNEVFDFKQMVVWDKGPMGMGWHYRRSYETVLVGQKPGAACRWFDDSYAVENIIRPGDYGIHKIIPKASEHPTAKCPELAAHFIRLHTQPSDVVCDPFMGHASTGVAAIRLGRKFVGIELDAEHFLASVDRIEAELNRFPLLEPKEPTQGSLLEESP